MHRLRLGVVAVGAGVECLGRAAAGDEPRTGVGDEVAVLGVDHRQHAERARSGASRSISVGVVDHQQRRGTP